jgi:hypothetical protein
MKSEATKTLKQIQRVIQSLEDRKLEIIQDECAVPLMEIVSIAREHDLSVELISYAMKQRAPRQPKAVPRKNKRSNASETVPNEPTMQ